MIYDLSEFLRKNNREDRQARSRKMIPSLTARNPPPRMLEMPLVGGMGGKLMTRSRNNLATRTGNLAA